MKWVYNQDGLFRQTAFLGGQFLLPHLARPQHLGRSVWVGHIVHLGAHSYVFYCGLCDLCGELDFLGDFIPEDNRIIKYIHQHWFIPIKVPCKNPLT
jgi:hypothetical protein